MNHVFTQYPSAFKFNNYNLVGYPVNWYGLWNVHDLTIILHLLWPTYYYCYHTLPRYIKWHFDWYDDWASKGSWKLWRNQIVWMKGGKEVLRVIIIYQQFAMPFENVLKISCLLESTTWEKCSDEFK